MNLAKTRRRPRHHELYEETRLRVEPHELGAPVWTTLTDLADFRQEDTFFYVEVETFSPSASEPTLAESAMGLTPKWWTVGEIRATTSGSTRPTWPTAFQIRSQTDRYHPRHNCRTGCRGGWSCVIPMREWGAARPIGKRIRR